MDAGAGQDKSLMSGSASKQPQSLFSIGSISRKSTGDNTLYSGEVRRQKPAVTLAICPGIDFPN